MPFAPATRPSPRPACQDRVLARLPDRSDTPDLDLAQRTVERRAPSSSRVRVEPDVRRL